MSMDIERTEIYRADYPAVPSAGLMAGHVSMMRTDYHRAPIEVWDHEGDEAVSMIALTPEMLAVIKETMGW